MPLTRYELRNEYSLADPELYRAADKDDPEALLEGVAMAGLVGLLRQLGDLAEFASEIFRSLHEEVMATAARGHGLTLRVQQLESEFPSIEKAIFSQTSHSLFLHNSGVDWHPNLRSDQSLITQGDLPRFVMDSYEECRGPPRLFLLDKFDTAGAGACLKRFTDPSFFKAEFTASEATKEHLKREKKARKVKKRGSRWKTGDNPEVTASHSKLHQLLLEERSQSQNRVHTHNLKLKRRHSSNSLVNSASGKSYMERFLYSHSPDRKFSYESSSIPSPSKTDSGKVNGLVPEGEIRENSLANVLLTRSRSPIPSHGREEKVLNLSFEELDVDVTEGRNSSKLLESAPEIELERVPSTFYKVDDKEELIVNPKFDTEAIVEIYHSDDANSEIDNYTDALTTMDSEMETDTESKTKNEKIFRIQKKFVDSETTEEQKEQAQFSDAQSLGSSLSLEDGNDSLEKGRFSSSYSDRSSNSAENIPSDGDLAAKEFPAHIFNDVDVSSESTSEMTIASGSRSPEYAVPNRSCNGVSEIPWYSSSSREASSGHDVTNVAPIISNTSPGASFNELQFFHPNSVLITGDMNSGSGQLSPKSENDGNAAHDLLHLTDSSNIPSQSRYDFLYVGSIKSQTVGILDGGNLGASNDTSMYLSDSGMKDVDGYIKDTLPTCVADDQMNGKLDSPDSVLLDTEADLKARLHSRLASECVSDSPTDVHMNNVGHAGSVGEAVPPMTKSESLTSVISCSETVNFREQNDPKITEGPLELEQTLGLDVVEVSIGDSEMYMSSEFQKSDTLDDSGAEMGFPHNNMEFNVSDYEVKYGHAPDMLHLNSSIIEREKNKSLKLPYKCFTSDEFPIQEADSEAADIRSEHVEDTVVFYNQDKQEITGGSAANMFTRSNAKKEGEKRQIAVPSDYNMKLCNLEKTYPSSPHFVDDAHDPHECINTHLDLTEGTEVALPMNESNQKEQVEQSIQEVEESPNHIYSSATSISSSIDPLIQPADWNILSPATSDKFEIFEQALLPLQLNSQGSGLNHDAIKQQLPNTQARRPISSISLPDKNDVQDSLEIPHLPPLPPMQWRIGKLQHDSPTSGGEMTLPSFNTLSPLLIEAADWTPQQGSPTLHSKLAQPLSPFLRHPTLEAKSPQHGFPMLMSAEMQPSLNTSSSVDPAVEYQNTQINHPISELTGIQPPNLFLSQTDWNLQQESSNSGEDMLQRTNFNPFTPASSATDLNTRRLYLTSQEELEQSSDSETAINHRDVENVHHSLLGLEGAIMQPWTSTTPPTIENEKHDYDSQTLGVGLKGKSNSLEVDKMNHGFLGGATTPPQISTAPPTIEKENHNYDSQSLEGELKCKSNSSEVEKVHDGFLDLGGAVIQSQILEAPPTIKNEKHEYDSQSLEGESKWKTISSAYIPSVDYCKPLGSLKSRLSRPRDPLIEAVASHDKNNLRKVAERIIPHIGRQMDERNSLLEQIRTKSFCLKPAVATRPSIQGPKTNLKVVAILEKANAIRQALAGSDEDDDEDSWSDS